MHFKYFDAHNHVHFPVYEKNRNEVIAHAIDREVGMVTVGTTFKTSEEAVKIAQSFMNVWAAVGIHPAHASESFHDPDEMGRAAYGEMRHQAEKFNVTAFQKLAKDPRVVAIGECGLDYFRLEGEGKEIKQAQKELFVEQIHFAHNVKKPLMIHCRETPSHSRGREAFPELIEILESEKKSLHTKNAGIIHFFSGTEKEAEQLLSLGFSFTFGGVITFPPKAGEQAPYHDLIKFLPIDRILSETDAPYVAPVPFRGKRNQPAYVTYVAKRLAGIRGITEEEMAAQIIVNTERVFRISLK